MHISRLCAEGSPGVLQRSGSSDGHPRIETRGGTRGGNTPVSPPLERASEILWMEARGLRPLASVEDIPTRRYLKSRIPIFLTHLFDGRKLRRPYELFLPIVSHQHDRSLTHYDTSAIHLQRCVHISSGVPQHCSITPPSERILSAQGTLAPFTRARICSVCPGALSSH